MKKTILSIAFTAFAMSGMAADNGKIHIKITAKNAGDTIVVVTKPTEQTFVGKQGVFDFEADVPVIGKYLIAEPQVLRGMDGAFFSIPLIPGETVELKSEEMGRDVINGSGFYSQYHEADVIMDQIKAERNDLGNSLNEMLQNGASQDSVARLYHERIAPIREKYNKAVFDFIKDHPDWEASAAIIEELPNLESMKAAVQILSESVREGRCKPLYQTVIDAVEAKTKRTEEAAKRQASGAEAPDFTLTDINGNPLKLSSLRGKHVILDFWGSWCGWCIKGFPEMKKYYEKYKGKFEILGVDCGDTVDKWKAAVEKHQLPWLHVYCPNDATLTQDYAIQGYPTKIIIGPDGKIVKTIIGEDPAFYTLLDELFK